MIDEPANSNEGPVIARRVYVSGRVQGVGFRMAAVDAATAIGARGTVRNLVDGRVEAVVEGMPDTVETMIEWLRSGPPWTSVDSIEITDLEPSGAVGFTIH